MGEVCVVALVDQWYVTYGEETWKNFIELHVHSDKFKTFNKSTLKGFEEVINWLKEWACSRTFGLGSKIPWDKQYLIESLSDSTIYMAYYTIANFLHEDLYGDKPKNGLTAEVFTIDVFDYIFLGKKFENMENCGINMDLLNEIRESFTYWYPQDLRCSGKDLVGNHLTMSLYNHAAVWNDAKWMPRGYFCNGYILVNGKKMSKQLGNFMTVADLIIEYGCDASRIAIADCGDGLDDANFVTEIANSAINRLYSFENFLKAVIKESWANGVTISDPDLLDTNTENLNYFDKIFNNNINYLVQKTQEAYEAMRFKDVLKNGFYELINCRDEYVLYNEDDYTRLNATVMVKFFKTIFILLNPIAPHWTEYMYQTYLNPIFKSNNLEKHCVHFLAKASFPKISTQIDSKLFLYNKYIKNIIQSINEMVLQKVAAASKGKGKGKVEKKEEEKDKEEPKAQAGPYTGLIKIHFAPNFTPEQHRVYEILETAEYADSNKIVTDYKQIIRKEMEKSPDALRTITLQFASFLVKEVETYGMDVLSHELPFNELQALKDNMTLINKLTKATNIEIVEYTEKTKPKGAKTVAIPGKPLISAE
jgi:leucyl-tRNA synthetase